MFILTKATNLNYYYPYSRTAERMSCILHIAMPYKIHNISNEVNDPSKEVLQLSELTNQACMQYIDNIKFQRSFQVERDVSMRRSSDKQHSGLVDH